MQVQRITTLHQLDELRFDWNRLAGDVPFLRWEWMRSWWVHFADQRELYVLVVRNESNHIVGIAPWFHETSLATGREIRFLGGDVWSEYLSLLCEDADHDEVANAVSLWLINAARPQAPDSDSWDLLRLTGIRVDTPAMSVLKCSLTEFAGTVNEKPASSCWRIPIPDTWDEYLAARPNPYRRKIRQLNEKMLASGRAVGAIATDRHVARGFFTTLVDLHQQRRESLRQQGCFDTPAFRSFLNDVVQLFAGTEHLFLAKLTIDGRAAAALLGFVFGKINYVYQCGMSPEFADCQPGWVLNTFTIQHAISHQLSGVDFLCGDQPYKAHLGACAVPMTQLSISAPRPLAQFRHQLLLGGERLKHWFNLFTSPSGRATPREN